MKKRAILGAAAAAAVIPAAVLSVAGSAHSTPAAATCKYRVDGALPDHGCTPGATNPQVTEATISTTICVSGWTATVRPPLSTTEPQKVAAIAAYGARFGSNLKAYEYDHLIPLEVGGSPDDPRNLWPEPDAVLHGFGSFDKDDVENHLNALVCDGKMTLAAAQQIFEHDWRKGIAS